MKPFVRFVVTLCVALVVVVVFSYISRTRSQSDEARLERVELKRQFLERSGVSRQLGADRKKDWQTEVQSLSRWYFDELSAIRSRHPNEKRKSFKVEEKDSKRSEELQEMYRYVQERQTLLREGKYQAIWSGADQGFHLDVISITTGKSPASGETGIQLDFALWGAPRRVDRETTGSRTTIRTTMPLVFRQMSFQILDAQGKPFGGMSGSGEPYVKIMDPERFDEDFPPGILFGTWWVDRFPREAVRAVLQITAEARGVSGGDLVTNFKYEFNVEDSWKVAAGETYKAEVREVTPTP